jgi:hypothetical protein
VPQKYSRQTEKKKTKQNKRSETTRKMKVNTYLKWMAVAIGHDGIHPPERPS